LSTRATVPPRSSYLITPLSSYFFEGLQTADRFVPSPQQRTLLDLARNYLNIPVREHREAIVALARALAERENGDEPAA
jgi:hypothetical protein